MIDGVTEGVVVGVGLGQTHVPDGVEDVLHIGELLFSTYLAHTTTVSS